MAKPSWVWKETAEVIGVVGLVASLLLLDNPGLIAARRAACSGSINDDQRIELFVFYAALLRLQLNRYQQAQLGIVDEQLALDLGGRGGSYSNPYFAVAWAAMKNEFSPGFQEFVERQLLPLSRDGCEPLGI